jgi:uncharacterized membrane protein YkvA (DUF1232 family)
MAKDSNGRGATKGRRRGAGAAVRRALGLLAFLPIASRIPAYGRLVLALAVDDRMPAGRKALLGGALGYLVFGRDIIPDDIPVVGGLDDLVVVALAVDLFLDGVPRDVLEEKLDELGIDRVAFDRDIAQIRRLTPGPVRRTFRRLPGLVGSVGDTIESVGLGPRLRTWISKEEPLA